MLTVNFNTDLLDAPIIDGIIFTTSETSLEVDNEFDIDLINISNYSVLKIENTNDNSVIKSINVDNLGSSLFIGKHFSNIKLNTLKDADIFLTASSNLTLSASGEFNGLKYPCRWKKHHFNIINFARGCYT